MTTAQLRLLGVLALQLCADTIQQLQVRLLRVLLERGDEGPAHCTGGLASDLGVLAIVMKCVRKYR